VELKDKIEGDLNKQWVQGGMGGRKGDARGGHDGYRRKLS